jgi:mannonate dehydratase
VASYDFHPGNTFSTGTAKRRGYTTREFDLDVFRSKVEKCQYGREYTADEIWANYGYFIKAVIPVAAAADVRLALHPDDPPVARMNGVNRIFNDYEGFRKAEALAESPYWGLLFCVGTWSEGGDRMGKDVFEMIRDFGGRNRIFEVHFRNVSSPLPRFMETFPDDGCVDMNRVMRALREVGYNGGLSPDHIPMLVGDENRRAGTAYCIAHARELLRGANRDVG